MNLSSEVPEDILDQIKAIDGCDGILFTGSRQQGDATSSSDWDFYVLLDDEVASFRKTWIYNGTFIETFCNTLASINEHELITSKISNPALRMLATGTIVQDKSGRLVEVQARAKQMYSDKPPELDDEAKLVLGYTLRAIVDDLESLEELSVEGYHLQNTALVAAVENLYRLEQRWMAKPRQIEQDIASIDANWSELYATANKATGRKKTEAIISLLESLMAKHNINSSGEVYQVRR